MSLDQLETVTIAPAPSIRGLLSDPQNVALSNTVSVSVENSGISDTNLIWMQNGNKGWDMPEATVITRPVASGVGDVQNVIRPKSRRFTMSLSSLVGDDTEYNKLVDAVATGYPFTIKFTYKAAAGKSTRVLPLCYYIGGLERMRYAAGRSTFKMKFYTEYPFFVSSTIAAGNAITPTNIRGRGVVWGVAATSDTIQTASIIAKVGAPISGGVADTAAWKWQWNPPGETPPGTVFGNTNPSGMISCFTPPYFGVYGLRGGTPLGGVDVSSGRTSGPQLPALLPATAQTVYVQPSTFRVWYWRDYAGL